MYVGIGPEKGKKVHDEDAFSYACERINNGTEREQETFMQIMKEAESFYMAVSQLCCGIFPEIGCTRRWLYDYDAAAQGEN